MISLGLTRIFGWLMVFLLAAILMGVSPALFVGFLIVLIGVKIYNKLTGFGGGEGGDE